MMHEDSPPAAAPEDASAETALARSPIRPMTHALAPVRGLIVLQNRLGHDLDELDVRRWVRLNVLVYKTQKIDLVTTGLPAAFLEKLFLYMYDPNNTSGV